MKKIFFALCLLLFYTSCEEEVPNPDAEVIIHERAIVADGRTRTNLVQIDSNSLIFEGTGLQLEEIETGDFLISDVAENAPNGYLRRIESKQRVGNEWVLTTSHAALTDVIINCDLSLDKLYSLSDTGTSKNGSTEGFTGQFDFPLYDLDGDPMTIHDAVWLQVLYDLNPRFIFDLTIRNAGLRYARFGLQTDESVTLSLRSAGYLLHVEEVIEIARIPLAPITLWAGIVPIVITNTIVISVGVQGQLMAEIETGITGEYSTAAYVEYENGQWSTTKVEDFNTTFQPVTINGEIEVKGFAEAALKMKLYDFENLKSQLSAEAYLKFIGTCSATAQDLDCDWQIKAGALVEGDIRIAPFNHVLLRYNQPIFDRCVVLAENNPGETDFFEISNPRVEWNLPLNDCYMDEIDAYGSSFVMTIDYDDDEFDEYANFTMDVFSNFSSGSTDYDIGESFDSFVTIDRVYNQISIEFCVSYGDSDWVDFTVNVYNEDYRSNGLTFRLERPAGANKRFGGEAGIGLGL